MRFKQLNLENLNTICPNNSKISLKELTKKVENNYLKLYFLYRKLFTEFIIEKIDLQKYDEKILNSRLNFPIVNEDNMDVYQYFSSDILTYFYIRNNIYIENLSLEERKFFQNRIDENNFELDDTARKIIDDTYGKIIFEDTMKNGEICETFYGPNSSSYLAQNDAVIIGVRYDEFNLNGLSDNEWDKLHDEQLVYLEDVLYKMKLNTKDKLTKPILFLRYNEFSVMNKDNDNLEKQILTEEER